MSLSRRQFLRAAAMSSGVWASGLWLPASRTVWAQTDGTVTDPSGTTLERSIRMVGDGPYRRLTYGPGWPIQVRTELAEAKRGREGRRVALVSFLHLTDFQLVDAQSPARVEFLDRTAEEPTAFVPVSAAQRPQEALIAQTVEAIVRQGNAVAAGPVTGRRLDFSICTGDNVDNRQVNELRWFLTLMNGGPVAANSGAADVFEGVQSFDAPQYYDPHYWHPEPVDDPLLRTDNYEHFYGFPDYPGLLDAAIQPLTASGIGTPWYSCLGNHDILVQGNEQPNPAYEAIATGGTKVLAPPPGWAPSDFYRGLVTGDPAALTAFSLAPARPVAADAERRFFSTAEYIQEHLDAAGKPAGHGFTEDNLDQLTFYYPFTLVDGVDGLVLDTNSYRSSEGSINQSQLAWLEEQLVARHSRYYDTAGAEVRTGNDDRLVVIFSHHRADSMLPIQGPTHSGDVEPRYGGDAVEAILHRFPNVIVWVNGHSHFNRVVPRPDPQGRTGGYWDITTSAQIDPPQQARILEIVDNRDGTVSIFTTIIDHAATPETEVGRYDVLGLASISRETSYNDYQSSAPAATGELTDLNVELLVAAPFRLDTTPAESPDARPADGDAGRGSGLPTTGGGIGAAAIGAAVTGALALRNRRPPSQP